MFDIDQLTQLFILGSLIVFGLLGIFYYFIFLKKQQEPKWKVNVKEKYRRILIQNIDQKLMLIELDKLLEYTLQQRFNLKKSLGEILKMRKKQFSRSELDQIWSAHKVRNKLVHDIEYNPNISELNRSTIVLKKTIKNIVE